MSKDIETTIINYLLPYKPKEISIFGSYARGEQEGASDVDLLVSFKQPLGYKYFGLADDLEKLLGKKVDMATPNSISKYIRASVEKDKKVIYQDFSNE